MSTIIPKTVKHNVVQHYYDNNQDKRTKILPTIQ